MTACRLMKICGRNTKINDADGRYIEFAKATFPRKMFPQKY